MEPYVIFLGDVALDEYYRVAGWPEDGGKAFADQLKPKHGGMIANAACVYAALGGKAKFVTALNCGAVSKTLINGLENSGVDTSCTIFDDSLADSKCMIFLTKENNTVLILNTGLEYYNLTEECFDAMIKAAYVYSTLSDLLRLKYKNMEGLEIVRQLRAAGVKIFCDLDTGYLDEETEEYYKVLDYAVFNHIGFKSYCGDRQEAEGAKTLLSYGITAVVVTKGERGCMVYGHDGCCDIPAFSVETVDVTGAGDTFCASLLYAIENEGRDVETASKFASAAAAIAVSGMGARAGAVSAQRVLEFIEKHKNI